jgi:hypothetical protein
MTKYYQIVKRSCCAGEDSKPVEKSAEFALLITRLFEILRADEIAVERQLRRLVVLLALMACGSPQTNRMGGSDHVELDLSDASIRMMPIADSVAVLVHGVSVYVFEYLMYDVGKETAPQALKSKFYLHFLPAIQDNSRPTLQKFNESLQIGSSSETIFLIGEKDSMTISVPDQQTVAHNPYVKADFYLFVQNLSFDVREQLFSGRTRRVYLRLNFDYAIWDANRSQVAKSGQVRLSERASFGVENGTFKRTFSQSTWSKTLSKAAKLVLKNSPLVK